MSLVLITNPPTEFTLSDQWGDFVAREGKSLIGTGTSIPIFTLTNWDASTTKPQIASGSIVEVGGSLYQADADTALTDEAGLADGTVHIKLVPAGGGATVVPTLTNDVIPAWDSVKAGWYDADDKFLPYEMVKTGAVYTEKSEYTEQNKNIKIGSTGIVYTGSISEKTASAGITINNTLKWKKYYKGNGITRAHIWSAINTWVPTTDNYLACFGQLSGGIGAIINIYRASVSAIVIRYLIYNSSTIGSLSILNDGASAPDIEIMSNFDSVS